MLRAVAIACRLGFGIHKDTVDAIRASRGEIVRSSANRILDEFYKILRQGAAEQTFAMLHDLGLLAYLFPEADHALSRNGAPLLASLLRLDTWRKASKTPWDALGQPVLLGSLLCPLGISLRRGGAAALQARVGPRATPGCGTRDGRVGRRRGE